MAKIDEIKEFINTLRTYLSIITAIILAIGAGVSKLYLSMEINLLFWIGIVFIVLLIIIFSIISRTIHVNVKKLKDLP
jgi:uncharacterized membrane protein